MSSLGCAREKANRLMAELDSRGIGLIETKRQGLGLTPYNVHAERVRKMVK